MLNRLLQYILIISILWLGSSCVIAADIVVFYEDAVSDYKVAMQEFVNSLDNSYQQECDYIGYSQYVDKPDMLTKFDCKLCVVIGTRPAKVAMETLPADVTIAYCMVYSPGSLKLLEGDVNFGISLKVDPQKQVMLIRKVLPECKGISTFIHAGEASQNNADLKIFEDSGMDLDLLEMPKNIKNSDRPGYVNRMLRGDPDIIWTYPDSHTFNMVTIKLSLLGGIKNKVPIFGYSEKVVKAGALFGLAVMPEAQGKELAKMTNAYLGGKDLEIRHEYAVFEPSFNLSVAEKLNVVIPLDMLESTDYVYGDIKKYRKKVGR